MRIVSLASGSKGNVTLVSEAGVTLLVDCGLNYKTLSERFSMMEPLGLDSVRGILLTHSHTDHTAGLRVFHRKYPDIPLYANAMTAEAIACEEKLPEDAFVCFENGQPFELGPFMIKAFSIPHDTSDPVGYLIKGSRTYFHGTDIGTPLDSVGIALAEADLAILESNHDPMMLRHSGRPPSLIQRIYGPRGHLSNDQAADLVRRFASPRLKTLALAHISRDCNAPHLAEAEMRSALAAVSREDVMLRILDQDVPVEL